MSLCRPARPDHDHDHGRRRPSGGAARLDPEPRARPAAPNPSWACRWVYDWTGSDAWAGVADWIVAKPLAITRHRGGGLGRQPGPAGARRAGRPAGRRPGPVRAAASAAIAGHRPGLVGRRRAVCGPRRGPTPSPPSAARWSPGSCGSWPWSPSSTWSRSTSDRCWPAPGSSASPSASAPRRWCATTSTASSSSIEDQYGVGDWVDLGPDAQGVVERVTLRSTRLRAFDGTVWHVPNGEVTRVGNSTQDFAYAVLDVAGRPRGRPGPGRAADHRASPTSSPPTPSGRTDVNGRPDLWGVNTLTREGATVRLLLKTPPGRPVAGAARAAPPGQGRLRRASGITSSARRPARPAHLRRPDPPTRVRGPGGAAAPEPAEPAGPTSRARPSRARAPSPATPSRWPARLERGDGSG